MAELLLANRIVNPLTLREIGVMRDDYVKMLHEKPFPNISGKHYAPMLKALKRDNKHIGPYVGITPFEAANRIASDLTLMEGVLQLFAKRHILAAAWVKLRLGTMHEKGRGDFTITDRNGTCEGEAFDVNPTFFRNKLYKTLKKWHKNPAFKYVVFNSDCLNDAGCKTYFLGMKQKYPQVIFLGVRSWHE